MSLEQQLAAGIQQHTDAAAFYQQEGQGIAQAKMDMAAQAQQAGQSIIGQLTALTDVISVYVDINGSEDGDGTGNNPYNTLEKALENVLSDRTTHIFLKPDQTYSLEPLTAYKIYRLHNICLEFRRWSSGGNPKIVVPQYVNPDNGLIVSCHQLSLNGNCSIKFQYVDVEILNQPGVAATNFGFIVPAWGALVALSITYGNVIVPPDQHLVSLYVFGAGAVFQLGYGEFSGGGDIVNSYYLQPIKMIVSAASIATDTFLLNRVYANPSNLLSAYNGSQLAREVS